MSQKIKKLLPWAITILLAYLMAKFITIFVIEKIEIPSGSMEPTLNVDDRLLLNKLAYTFSKPKRGDIIVFKNPSGSGFDLIKRVIGLPGEIVTFENDKVYIDGEELNEPYVHGKKTVPKTESKYVIPYDCYFVMGDNRTNSTDSRAWDNPFVTREMIKGKVNLRYKPSIEWVK